MTQQPLSPDAHALLEAFRARQRAQPDSRRTGNQASKAYDALVTCWTEDAVLELILSGILSGRECHELYGYGGHGGSVSKRDNPRLVAFNPRLRAHYDQLPVELQRNLDWLRDVHDY